MHVKRCVLWKIELFAKNQTAVFKYPYLWLHSMRSSLQKVCFKNAPFIAMDVEQLMTRCNRLKNAPVNNVKSNICITCKSVRIVASNICEIRSRNSSLVDDEKRSQTYHSYQHQRHLDPYIFVCCLQIASHDKLRHWCANIHMNTNYQDLWRRQKERNESALTKIFMAVRNWICALIHTFYP